VGARWEFAYSFGLEVAPLYEMRYLIRLACKCDFYSREPIEESGGDSNDHLTVVISEAACSQSECRESP
jgi:hypothetical protein